MGGVGFLHVEGELVFEDRKKLGPIWVATFHHMFGILWSALAGWAYCGSMVWMSLGGKKG